MCLSRCTDTGKGTTTVRTRTARSNPHTRRAAPPRWHPRDFANIAVLQLCSRAAICKNGCVTELLSRPLRERKRAETWTTIHNAAAELTLEMGLHVVTVEAIADQSNISSRTFFNYFNSKEDAILGLQEPVIADEVRNDFVITEDLLSRVSTLLLTVAQSTFGGDYATSRRFEVLERYPELIQRRIAYITAVEDLVAALVEERLEESGQWRDELADIPCGETAKIIVMMASAAMRFAMQRGSPPVGTAAQFEALDSATTLFRRILRKAV
ncbi:hypothetical protein GCM10027562_21440 [Arthrobacter pigmenti]